MADTLCLTILPHVLTIASFPKAQLPACAHGLLFNILYNEDDEQFFSYTESNDLCTIIMSKTALSTFPKDFFEFSPHLYRAVEITGSLGAAATGIVHSVSVPLNNIGISIFYLSTYDTDYVLVPVEDLEQAVGILRTKFTIFGDDDLRKAISSGEEKAENNALRRQHPLALSRHLLHLAGFRREHMVILGTLILKMIFFPETEYKGRMFSVCVREDTVSLILSPAELNTLRSLDPSLNVYNVEFQRIFIDDGYLGFDEPGIVEQITRPLARKNISLFHLSTFSTDHTLVASEDIEVSFEALAEAGFVVKKL